MDVQPIRGFSQLLCGGIIGTGAGEAATTPAWAHSGGEAALPLLEEGSGSGRAAPCQLRLGPSRGADEFCRILHTCWSKSIFQVALWP